MVKFKNINFVKKSKIQPVPGGGLAGAFFSVIIFCEGWKAEPKSKLSPLAAAFWLVDESAVPNAAQGSQINGIT